MAKLAPDRWITFGTDDAPLAMIESRAWREWKDEQKRVRTTPIQRAAIIERDGLICGICGGDVEPSDLEIDHVTPISRGGTSDPTNLQVAHATCNRRKGNS